MDQKSKFKMFDDIFTQLSKEQSLVLEFVDYVRHKLITDKRTDTNKENDTILSLLEEGRNASNDHTVTVINQERILCSHLLCDNC